MLKTKINTILLCTLFTLFFPLSAGAQYRNPILYADVPDMSVCRAGDYFLHGFHYYAPDAGSAYHAFAGHETLGNYQLRISPH